MWTPGASRDHECMKRGFTTLELAIVMTLMALVTVAVAPTVLASWDRLRVRAAREEVAGQVQRARSAALRSGRATLELRADSGLVRVVVDESVESEVDLGKRYGVGFSFGGTPAARLRFGRLGLGRVASRTVGLFRRADTVSVSLSTFGRLRRW